MCGRGFGISGEPGKLIGIGIQLGILSKNFLRVRYWRGVREW